MKKSKFVLFSLLAIALSMSACAKKDSKFSARYAKNKMGADVANGPATQTAAEVAAAKGLEADIVNIQRYWTPEGQPGPRLVVSNILINNQEMPVTTSHMGTEVVEGKVDVNGYTVVFHAMCANSTCNPYFATMEIYKNNAMVIQEGVRKYFEKSTDEERDIYQWFQPGEALPFMDMVKYLNSSGGALPTGIVK